MTRWTVTVPPRLYEEFAHLSPAARRAVHDVLKQLAIDPRDPSSSTEPITGAELRRIDTAPAADTGERVTLLYRVQDADDDQAAGRVSILFVLSGP
ncbi:type II toxin-antitoxin system RelE/ParE family toxin [Streptomyces sp. NPDC057910]|uniref:type II toxin-antitoxin system RelE family toxin n=1 Tax=Streptomyces sp. NPDC057910 TaxID=3346278 RepID=UPI0036E36FBE